MEYEINNAIKTINAQLENALRKEKETEGTENTVFWHLVANDYGCSIKALEGIQKYRAIGTVEECQEAMERHNPKLPDIYGDGYDCDGNIVYDMWDCPNCGKSYEIDYHDYKYCPECGQAIDWSAEVQTEGGAEHEKQ